MQSASNPLNVGLGHSVCDQSCRCRECGACWYSQCHSARECVALQYFLSQEITGAEISSRNARRAHPSLWCAECGACWAQEKTHIESPCLLQAQVQDMITTGRCIRYRGDNFSDEAIQLSRIHLTTEDLPMLPSTPLQSSSPDTTMINEASFDTSLGLQLALETPKSSPGLDRSAIFDSSSEGTDNSPGGQSSITTPPCHRGEKSKSPRISDATKAKCNLYPFCVPEEHHLHPDLAGCNLLVPLPNNDSLFSTIMGPNSSEGAPPFEVNPAHYLQETKSPRPSFSQPTTPSPPLAIMHNSGTSAGPYSNSYLETRTPNFPGQAGIPSIKDFLVSLEDKELSKSVLPFEHSIVLEHTREALRLAICGEGVPQLDVEVSSLMRSFRLLGWGMCQEILKNRFPVQSFSKDPTPKEEPASD